MSGHDKIRRMLALAAAGALSPAEQREVDRHAAGCEECARELGVWQELGASLGRLPTPLAPAAMVERTRALVERNAAAAAESRWEGAALAFVTLLSWALAGSLWAAMEVLGFGLSAQRIAIWSAIYILLSTLASGAAAALLAARRRAWSSL